MSSTFLTLKQEKFAHALLTAPSAVEAYVEVYDVSPNASRQSLWTASSRLRRHPGVRARYEQLARERLMPPLSREEAQLVYDHVKRVLEAPEGKNNG